LREFLTAKLKRDAGIDCVADDILHPSRARCRRSTLVNATLLARGDNRYYRGSDTYQGALNRLTRRASTS